MKKIEYEGQTISFEFSGTKKMINATQMAKPFGKRINNFLRLPRTQEYIHFLQQRYANSRNAVDKNVLRVIQGGEPHLQGTRMDEKLALKFASRLSPAFELWVYDRIYELITTGITQLHHSPTENIIQGLRVITDQLESNSQEITILHGNVNQLKDVVAEIEAKITSIDENYYSISGYCALQHIDCPLPQAQKRGSKATTLSKQKQIAIGKAYDAKYGDVNTYHVDILEMIIENGL